MRMVTRPAAMEALIDEKGENEKQRPVTNAGRHYYFVGIKLDADAAFAAAVKIISQRRPAG